MARSVLDISKRNSGVEGGGHEAVPQAVRADPLGDPGPPGDSFDGARIVGVLDTEQVEAGHRSTVDGQPSSRAMGKPTRPPTCLAARSASGGPAGDRDA